MLAMLAVIKNAIENKLLIDLQYDPGGRVVEPHCLGISSEGHRLLRAYQRRGASASGESPEWKLFRIDRIEMLKATNECFTGPRPQYNPNDPAMKGGIISRL
jgi:predicted DNA-binding transcriptional regulator YafY